MSESKYGYFSRSHFSSLKNSNTSPGAYWFDKYGNEIIVSFVMDKPIPPNPLSLTDIVYVGELNRFSRQY